MEDDKNGIEYRSFKPPVRNIIEDESDDYEVPGKDRRPKNVVAAGVAGTLKVIGTTLLSLFLVIIITVCIIAVSVTAYVMQFAENAFDVDLKDVDLSFSSFLKAYDKDGNEVTIKQLSTDQNRVWVSIDDMPKSLIDAVVANEDQRFFEHDGVDWTRTVGVTVKFFGTGNISAGGGSTITQQLVRDITKDNKENVGRKLREIFRALSLEQKYTKIDILESYLNRIGFGGTSYGVGSAAQYYFGKNVKDLTIAESAILSGIIRSPSNYNPYASLKQCRTRQLYVLDRMYDLGYITTKEYEEAKAEKVRFRLPVAGDYFGYIDERYNEFYGLQDKTNNLSGKTKEEREKELYYADVPIEQLRDDVPYKWKGTYATTQSWYDDAVIAQVADHFAQLRGITVKEARDQIKHGGYTIYSNVDLEKQKIVEEKFKDPLIAMTAYNQNASKKDLLQAAFVVMDYRGRVVALAGGLGEKEGDDCFNRATQSYRAVGSTIKPLSAYGPAINMNLITYSTMIPNVSGSIAAPEPGNPSKRVRWPYNYEENYPANGGPIPAWYAVQQSTNTVAVRVVSMVGLKNAYAQLTEKLGFSSLDPVKDLAYSPLALGALTKGVRLHELAAAFQIYGNGGVYYKPYLYSKVIDNNGKIVLQQDVSGIQAVEKDSAWIVNRMMKKVIDDPGGTGKYAKIANTEVIGKTGTANDMSNLVFTGLTPDLVGVYRIGYDDNKAIPTHGQGGTWRAVARVWQSVMADMVPKGTERTFTPESSVLTLNYCTETGLIVTASCPNKAVGYYRASNIPPGCDSSHDGTYWSAHGDKNIPQYD
jgi:penicillin-binding protein 1A